MSPAHAFVLFFVVCSPRACEEGFMLARSCAAAQEHIVRTTPRGHRLILGACEERSPAVWSR